LERSLVVALILLAAAIRIAHLLELRHDPFIDRPIMDAEYHDSWARALVGGMPFGEKVFFRAPLYPYALAGVYRLFGAGPWPARIVQMALGLASLLLLHRLARRLLGRRAALIALLLGVLYDLLPFYEGELLIKALIVFLDLLAIERFAAFLGERRTRDLILAGAIIGLSAIARPNVLAIVPGLTILAVTVGRARRGAVAFVVASLLCPLAITGVNWVRGGEPVFIASQGGLNFFLGNNRSSNGWSAVAPELRPDWWGGYEDMIRIPQAAAGRKLAPSEVSAYWTRRALSEIAADPAWWLWHLARKATLWFGAEELSNNRDLRFWTRRSWIIHSLPVRYAQLVPLALLGALLVPWRRTAPLILFVLPYALSFIAFFVTSRYRLVTVPFLAILSAGALDRLAILAHRRELGALAPRLALLAVFVLVFSSRLVPVLQPTFALSYQEISRREMERGRWAEAVAACRKALEYEPGNLDARHDLGLALREGGDPEAALAELNAVAESRGDATAWNNVALTLWALGRREEAHAAFAKAIASDPSGADPWLNSALMFEEDRDWAAALSALERGGDLRQGDPMVWYHKGLVLVELGRRQEARTAFENALELAPNLNDARIRLEALDEKEPNAENPGGQSPVESKSSVPE